MATKKLYKVQKSGGSKMFDVIAETFEELVDEGSKHLELEDKKIEITLEDNTIVDTDYFQSLKPDTLLIFKSKYSEDKVKSLGEKLEACSIQQPDNVTDCLERKPNIKAENLVADEDNDKEDRKDDEKWSKDTVEALAESFQDCISNQPDMLRDCLKKHPNIPKFISDEGKGGNMKEKREDDEEWFKGVPIKFTTKSEFMRYKAHYRTYNNFQKIKRKLLPNNSNDEPAIRTRKKEVIKNFKEMLIKNKWYEQRFDRNDKGNQKLCNRDGTFKCQGAYNEGRCPHSHHRINPYLRNDYWREFSSWNLEHQTQKGRKVLPRLKKALEDPLSRTVNWVYFYELLFTMKNFKLVHRACHRVEDHEREVKETKVFQ